MDKIKTGYFNDGTKEYIIQDMYPGRLLYNFIWNEAVLARVNQFCCGDSFYRDSGGIRRTLCRTGDSRLIFVKEKETVWCTNRNFDQLDHETFYTRVGQGRSAVTSKYRDLETVFEVFVPPIHAAECWRLQIKNTGSEEKSFDLFAYADIMADISGHTAYSHGEYKEELFGIALYHQGFQLETEMQGVFFAAKEKPDYYETSNRRFQGVYGRISHPDAIKEGNLSCQASSFDSAMMAALQYRITLAPGESRELRFVLGPILEGTDEVEIAGDLLKEGGFEKELDQICKRNEQIYARMQIETPDENLNRLANLWLKHQMNFGKTWGRVYAKGFRDIMQDSAGLMPLNYEAGAEKIKLCLAHQYPDGNTLRQWEGNDYHPYRDGAAWILPAVTRYLKESGDFSLLTNEVPYFESKEAGTVLDHCTRGMEFLFTGLGEHGLCLWGGGDWNDSINNTGLQGIGESVWLSEAAICSAEEYAELLVQLGQTREAQGWKKKAEMMRENLRRYAWDSDHFICGYNDWNEKVGAYENEEGKIFLNMQSWAVLSETLKADEADRLMDLVEEELSCSFGYVLMKPSYTKPDDHIGRVTYMQPGSYENGSVYNHGVAFKIAADCKLGRADNAWKTLQKILPLTRNSPASDSGAEPYAITNMYLGPENSLRAGESLMAWITGAAGWIYRCITEMIVGIKAEYNGLSIEPCFPKEWEKISATRHYRGAVYHFNFDHTNADGSGEFSVIVDGKILDGKLVPAFHDGKEHMVQINFRSRGEAFGMGSEKYDL
ncbi:cellobiose phosphorylase [Anaerotaenia torta]|uniref:GH36-type glycosyl hydrolase domain-containing protein n=1 Tax=Anaerotaenia torta TaxID=433293 RepID=UPI003D220848